MTTSKPSLFAIIVKHLLRGKSMIQSILAYWLAPASSTKSPPLTPAGSSARSTASSFAPGLRSTSDFLREVEDLILGPLAGNGLVQLSRALKAQFRIALQSNPECMLPSYNHKLPSGRETGRYLALDVGGSTLRVALLELRGQGKHLQGRESEIVRMQSFRIGKDVKDLEGVAFFDWMAAKIVDTLSHEREGRREQGSAALPMSLAWSFPIEQTALRGGRIHDMGKGFCAARGLQGQDLGGVIEAACDRAGLSAELRVILNDGNATLISRAYTHQSTRFGLILGTGVNIAAYLPVPLIGRSKFGENRPSEWFDEARSVIVNTELGMFGKDVLNVTRWDALLKGGLSRPWFQPLEHMVSGMYLGEVVRLVLLEAIVSTGVFGGVVPEGFDVPYGFSTETMSIIECDSSPTLETAAASFTARHPASHIPTTADLAFLCSLCILVSRRSAGIVAASLHAMWELRLEGVREDLDALSSAEPSDLDPVVTERRKAVEAELTLGRTMIAFNGSVIESYPGYKYACQRYIDDLVAASGNVEGKGVKVREGVGIDLVPAKESSIIGAGVALAASMCI